MNNSSGKLSLLRSAIHSAGIDAYIIPSTDPHIEEEVPDHWRIIEWLTGFTGSSANVIVTSSFAGLWTDSRYFIQAERELRGSGYRLMKPETGSGGDLTDFLLESLDEGNVVGFDGKILSAIMFRKITQKLERKKIKFISGCDLITDLWLDRPTVSSSPAFNHPLDFCGKSRERKISVVRERMKIAGASWQLLTASDDIMWLLNIRGNDLKFSPLVDSFSLVGEDQVLLFINEQKITPLLSSEFDKAGVVMLPYEAAYNIIPSATENSRVLLNASEVSVEIYNSISAKSEIIEDITIPASLKSIKNKTEIENLVKVMVKDGVALIRFLYWVEDTGEKLSENALAEKLHEFRSMQADFLGPSFAPIVAFGENSALPHYSPQHSPDALIDEGGILLIDSGGHYLGGTTDITRTISTGSPSNEQQRDFTLVLKGHIGLATAKFPSGTRGYQLDILARKALWKSGMNYGHGTGHGIGFCLNVHEGPQSISPSDNKTVILPGMVISNEPAIYREGKYGIRTENVMICYEDEETEFGRFLKFDTISLCYIDKSLIDKSMLDTEEIDWINSYHFEVYEKISPHLSKEEKEWLSEKTAPL